MFSFCTGPPNNVAVPISRFLWMQKAPCLPPPLLTPVPFFHHRQALPPGNLPRTEFLPLSNILMENFSL